MYDQIIALIPAYMPQKELPQLLVQLRREGVLAVVVNDGSGPEFSPVFEEAAQWAHVIAHPENRGKGAALKTGLRYIAEHFYVPYVVVTADADGQHRVGDIVRVAREAAVHPDSLVLGSRAFDKDVPLRSRFGNTVTRAVYRLTSGVRVFDTQTGLRAFSHRLMGTMTAIGGTRYEYEMNVLMELPRASIPIREVPIETVYLDGNSSSHFDTFRDSLRIYREILRFSASSLISFLADYGLFCLLSVLTGMLVFSNVAARLCSSVLNFTLNRRFVFDTISKETVGKSAVKYFSLAAVILLCNTLILKLLTLAGLGSLMAKLMTELVLFLFSYVVQHRFVFRKECRSA